MQRIASLIRQLQDQLDRQAGPSDMMATLRLLELELASSGEPVRPNLGTAKIAVVLPVLPATASKSPATEPELLRVPASAENEPAPSMPEPAREIKETLLVEDGSVSLLKKNGQLDMVFDPLTEIPTLAQQPVKEEEQGRVVFALEPEGESLNDKLKQTATELVESLKETPIRDLRKAIGINDRYLFINELFRGDENMYERCIKTINNFNIYAEAEYWINRELKVKLGWVNDNPTVQHFDHLVKRRFS